MNNIERKWKIARRHDKVECPECGYVGTKGRIVAAAGCSSHCNQCGFVKYGTTPMRDSQMDLHPDPMCIPTMATFKEWGEADSFANDLRQFIEFIHDENNGVDTLDQTAIY